MARGRVRGYSQSGVATSIDRALSVPPEPRVSICVPTYNGARWLPEAIESALAQTHEDFELLVCDNQSTDDTQQILAGYSDPRLRVVLNERQLGLGGNHNRCVELARGAYIKFLHADDMLAPTCLERLLAVAETSERIDVVFAPRTILLEDPADPAANEWLAMYGRPHACFADLQPVNDGRKLFAEWLAALASPDGVQNWVGEETAALVRRSAWDKVGLFNTGLSTYMDIDMWLRLFFFADVGFVDDDLATYRHHDKSVTAGIAATRQGWLDRLWMFEGLASYPEILEAHPELRRMRRQEEARVARLLVGRIARGRTPSGVGEYATFRFRGSPKAQLYPPLTRDRASATAA
jgi:glycosyltransferase involved in cell wall biosynthesis